MTTVCQALPTMGSFWEEMMTENPALRPDAAECLQSLHRHCMGLSRLRLLSPVADEKMRFLYLIKAEDLLKIYREAVSKNSEREYVRIFRKAVRKKNPRRLL